MSPSWSEMMQALTSWPLTTAWTGTVRRESGGTVTTCEMDLPLLSIYLICVFSARRPGFMSRIYSWKPLPV